MQRFLGCMDILVIMNIPSYEYKYCADLVQNIKTVSNKNNNMKDIIQHQN